MCTFIYKFVFSFFFASSTTTMDGTTPPLSTHAMRWLP